MEEKARMSDTRARLARCEIYKLSDQGGGRVCLTLPIYSTYQSRNKIERNKIIKTKNIHLHKPIAKLVICLFQLGAKKGVRDTLSSTPLGTSRSGLLASPMGREIGRRPDYAARAQVRTFGCLVQKGSFTEGRYHNWTS